jgi:hypothetical protein
MKGFSREREQQPVKLHPIQTPAFQNIPDGGNQVPVCRSPTSLTSVGGSYHPHIYTDLLAM